MHSVLRPLKSTTPKLSMSPIPVRIQIFLPPTYLQTKKAGIKDKLNQQANQQSYNKLTL